MHHRVTDEVTQIAFPSAAILFGKIDKGLADDHLAFLIDDLLPWLYSSHHSFICSSNNNNTSQTS